MHLYKIIFLSTLMMGTLISVSSITWLGTWMGLEINLLSFIPLMKEKNNPYASESSMKYFLVQALASAVFFFSIIIISGLNFMNSETFLATEFILMTINSSLLLKMGAAPFHFWFPEIIEGMSWINSLILMTWQKIAPMMILSYSLKSSSFIMMIIIMCSIIGSIGGLNQTSLRKIMAFSSINHIGWMISSFLMNEMVWLKYFSIYSLISSAIILLFNSFNIFYLSQMFILMNKNILIKFSMLINLLSLGGLPPFLGFLPKWMIIQQLSNNYSFIVLLMILATLITLFFYMRIAYTSIMLNHNQMNFSISKVDKMSTMNFILTFMSLTGLMTCTLMFNLH
uniref:NADH-ubiquinone oxidoreductase chain 2 n=1 Tax=Abroscelis anchoralis TaxID=212429 RepID=A0A344ARA2_ABRAC|nr:NADH dehydrogenase subunit 2 [Abroscelis anchoralis]AWX64118.1 NADH dehydrogenase subunit 2 [Abroscelis anchoralis]